MGKCEHKDVENIKSNKTIRDCNHITQRCKNCGMKRYVHKGKNVYETSKWFNQFFIVEK